MQSFRYRRRGARKVVGSFGNQSQPGDVEATMNTRLVLVSLLAALLTAGCGAATTSGGDPDGPATRDTTPRGDGSTVVLRVSTGGGFVPLEFNLRAVPEFSLYGDGTVIVPGAVPAIYPGPAIYPLHSFTLSQDRMQALIEAARQSGLLDGPGGDYGDMGSIGITDMPTTTVLLNVDGKQVVHDAYALFADSGANHLTPAQSAARKTLAKFLSELPQDEGAAPYTPAALAVHVAPYRGQPELEQQPAVWPLGGSLANDGTPVSHGLEYRCIVVDGADVQPLLTALEGANEETPWLAQAGGSREFRLVVRPVLPGEHACG